MMDAWIHHTRIKGIGPCSTDVIDSDIDDGKWDLLQYLQVCEGWQVLPEGESIAIGHEGAPSFSRMASMMSQNPFSTLQY